MKLANVIVSASLLLGGSAMAAPSSDVLPERPLETAQGAAARASRVTTWRTPDAARTAWASFTARHGAWKAIWDGDTSVPLRTWGPSIAAPGANASDAIAERAALAVLTDELALLAPGAELSDLVPIANVVHGSSRQFRTVSFARTAGGLTVEGAAVTFLFQNDRLMLIGSTAGRDASARLPAQLVDAATATDAAVAWIAQIYGGSPEAGAVGDPLVLPIVLERDDGRQVQQYRTVVPVTVDLASPRGRWTVYADAATGAPIARAQRLMFAQGTITYRVGERWPGGTHYDYPAAFASHHVGATAALASATGVFSWNGTAAATVTTGLTGTYVRVHNAAGAVASANLTVQPGGSASWNPGTTGTVDAQLTSYIWLNLIKDYARATLNPDLDWIDAVIDVTVNESGNCNAYSTGDDVHFYVASQQCENTGRLSDVIRHEFGHSLHGNSIIPGAGNFDGALSEGVSDYLSATYVNDPAMGLGFFFNAEALRHLDPGTNKVYPDDLTGEVHDDGEIIAQALWDVRKAMVGALGQTDGVALADDFYYAVIQRASDIPSSYPEILAADDDDGDLSNGTPHKCLIDDARALHGLAAAGSVGGATLAPPTLSGLTVSLVVDDGSAGVCPPPPVSSARATWRLRSSTSTTGNVDLTGSGSTLSGTLPDQADGEVVQYQVVVTFEGGATQTFPNNAADPWYETYVGPVTQLWCANLDTDPALDGWQLGGDFEWGPPASSADATGAFSGANVIGNDLSDDGNYEPGASNTLTSPSIQIDGSWEHVRLQYRRWLGVEDAQYDHATISVDGAAKWNNLETAGGSTQHRDREWRFQDIEVTGEAADGTVQLAFALSSDEGLEFGGWNIDDICIVAAGAGSCGDGLLSPSTEECDDGNTADGDGCTADCMNEGGTGPDGGAGDDDNAGDDDSGDDTGSPDGGCCSTTGGTGGSLALGLLTLVGVVVRRRRCR
jgi:uncharacterized protein (TIGR03382 family)